MKNKVTLLLILIIVCTCIVMPITYSRYISTYNDSINLAIRQPKYYIAYNANDAAATGEMQNQEFEYGTAQTLTPVAYTRKNAAFEGWNTSSDGTGATYLNEEEISLEVTEDNAIVPLYAMWAVLPYTVTYVNIDGTDLPSSVNENDSLVVTFTYPVTINSVTMDNNSVLYTFNNNVLTINNVIGNIVIDATIITSEQPEYVFEDITSNYNKTFTGSAAITTVTELIDNGYVVFASSVTPITSITETIDYTISGGDKSLNVLVYINDVLTSVKLNDSESATTANPATFIKKQSTLTFTISGINVSPFSVIKIVFESNGGNNNGNITVSQITIKINQ